jgi:Protein of unknown function (DUF2585)
MAFGLAGVVKVRGVAGASTLCRMPPHGFRPLSGDEVVPERQQTSKDAVVRRLAPWLTIAVMVLCATAYLRWQGRVWWCQQGDPWPTSINVNSPHNSQHFFDPYSLSHMLHGFLFFALLWLVRVRLDTRWRLVAATAIEVAWEVLENSPIIINRYRSATISIGYEGDAVLNSLGDIVSFVIGYFIASRLKLWQGIGLFLLIDLAMLVVMRDNLATNVLMLLWPIDAVRRWQSGG